MLRAAALDQVGVLRTRRWILRDITWHLGPGDRWLLLGANGSGKTSLIRLLSLYEHPTTGRVEVLGEELGRTDVRQLRRRIGLASAALADQFRPALTALEVVMTAHFAALEPWWHTYDDDIRCRAGRALDLMRVGHLGDRAIGTLSSGEQQRVFLARALMNEPGLLLLDEPSARLDLGGREELVGALCELVHDPTAPPVVLVTHRVDEVPPGMTHVLLLRDGEVLAMGPLTETLSSDALSECFGVDLVLDRLDDGRLSARARPTTR